MTDDQFQERMSRLNALRAKIDFAEALNTFLKDVEPVKPVRYEADHQTVQSLLRSLSTHDWNSRSGIGNHQRGVAADSLSDLDREDEAALLRSDQPIVVTASGKVKLRRGTDDIHKRFLDAYKTALLDHSFDAGGEPLRLRHKVTDYSPEAAEEVTKRASRFLSDVHPIVAQKMTPQHLGEAFVRSHNLLGEDFSDHPGAAALNQETVDRLTTAAEAQGDFWLKSKGRKLVEGHRPEWV